MPIRDNPGFKNLEDEIKVYEAFAPLRPLLRVFGASGKRMAKALDDIEELQEDVSELSSMPDRFNQQFRERGWIAYEDMSHNVMRDAVERADTGCIDAAEQALMGYYDRETIQFALRRCRRIRAFRIRERLLLLALEDHEARRFYASVPVVLSQVDGIAYDLTGGTIYASNPDELARLIVDDSIAGHQDGVATLVQTVFGSRRDSTTTEALSQPHRHGILHGRDLEYDNELVSTKCFALVLALGSLAPQIERERLKALALVKPTAQEQPSSWSGLWHHLVEESERRRRTFLEFPENVSSMRDSDEAAEVSESYWIPGFRARRLAGKLAHLGFEWKDPVQGETMLYWTGSWRSPHIEYQIDITGLDDQHIHCLNATYFNYGPEPIENQAEEFLAFIATIPYEGATPTRARNWVIQHVNNFRDSTVTSFGGARFGLFRNERTRRLQITGNHDIPDCEHS